MTAENKCNIQNNVVLKREQKEANRRLAMNRGALGFVSLPTHSSGSAVEYSSDD